MLVSPVSYTSGCTIITQTVKTLIPNVGKQHANDDNGSMNKWHAWSAYTAIIYNSKIPPHKVIYSTAFYNLHNSW